MKGNKINFFVQDVNVWKKNHQFKGLGSVMTWLEVWKSIREKPVKKCFVEDLNSLEKEKSFGGSRSVLLCIEVLRKAILLQYFTYIFFTRSTKSGHEIYFFTFEKYIIWTK